MHVGRRHRRRRRRRGRGDLPVPARDGGTRGPRARAAAPGPAMKFVDEYRDAALVRKLADAIARTVTRPWTVMEICGGQTHAIVKFGLDELLPPGVTLVHGPGCPVCVTPAEMIDQAVELSLRPGVTLCSFGDMLRVPGIGHRPPHGQGQGRGRAHGLLAPGRRAASRASIPTARSSSSPSASRRPRRPTRWRCCAPDARACPTSRWWSRTCSCRPPCARSSARPDNLVQGFLAAGHVCAVMGTAEYGPIATGVPARRSS